MNLKNIKIAYRIVEEHPSSYKTLFHGVKGSRVIPFNRWLIAEEKMVKDGTSKTSYLSGFHALPTEEECREFLAKKFTTRLEKLKIAKIEVRGLRWKKHSRSNIILAKKMRIIEVLN